MSKDKSMEEDEVFEFLNSLPESGNKTKNEKNEKSNNNNNNNNKTDEDILDFLDELEASDKKLKKNGGVSESSKKDAEFKDVPLDGTAAGEAAGADTNDTTDSTADATTPSSDSVTSSPVNENIPVNDPITSFSNWWSREGSAKMTSQVSSFWGTAASISKTAQEKAEEAIKLAKEKTLEENLSNAFKQVGITSVLDLDENGNLKNDIILTKEQRQALMKLPDTKLAIESINKGFGFFSDKLSNVIDQIQNDLELIDNNNNNKDEILDIKLVHDLQNYPNIIKYIKNNFEYVMKSQVDGSIDIKITESGISSIQNSIDKNLKNLGIFYGKLSDGEKLIKANIDSIIKEDEKILNEDTEEVKVSNKNKNNNNSRRITKIYIGVLACATQTHKDNINSEESDTIIIDSYSPQSFTFTAILRDVTHDLTFINRSQPFPLKWAKWLDGSAVKDEKKGEEEEEEEEGDNTTATSEDEGIDPSEWVVDWVNRGLDMTFGILSQSYIIKRMNY
ncbi:hypothetical protein B5S31_g4571 [[Candida] boidinii]|nr:hypothetical protein B5S31_g4571 [[Candida] boidinii]